MRKKKVRGGKAVASLALAFVVCAAAPQGTAVAENLADAMAAAYNSSGLIEQNRALMRTVDEDVAIAVSALRPVVNAVFDYSKSFQKWRTRSTTGVSSTGGPRHLADTLTANLTLDQLLADGGATRLGADAAEQIVLSSRQTLLSIEQRVLIRAVAAYMNVIQLQEIVSLRENNAHLLNEELRATQDRFDLGEVTRTDVALAQSRLAEAQSNLATARGNLVSAKAEYVTVIGHEPRQLVPRPPLPDVPPSVDAALALAMRNHPDILDAQFRVASADLLVQQAEKRLGPTTTLSVSTGVAATRSQQFKRRDEFAGAVGIRLSQPIYQGGRLSARVRRAQASSAAARSALLVAQQDVAQSVTETMSRLRVANSSLEAIAERIRAASTAFEGVREEARLGARTTLDVLTSEQDLLDAQSAEISATAEKYIAAYQVLQAQGMLTAEKLGLPVQIYDPSAYFDRVKNAPTLRSVQGRQLDQALKALGQE